MNVAVEEQNGNGVWPGIKQRVRPAVCRGKQKQNCEQFNYAPTHRHWQPTYIQSIVARLLLVWSYYTVDGGPLPTGRDEVEDPWILIDSFINIFRT